MKKYEGWFTSENQTEVFFGDLVSDCFKLKLDKGNLVIIPSGWIHAMYARTNSILIGGNFANTLRLTTQLRVHAIETSCGLSPPNFKNIFWYIGLYYKTALGECAIRKRQFRRRRGQIEREGTKLSKIKGLRAKLKLDHTVKLKRARVVADQKIKILTALGGKPSEPKPLPPLGIGKGKGRGAKGKGKGFGPGKGGGEKGKGKGKGFQGY